MQEKVDFSYAFGVPHRVTVAMPDSSNKTLVDAYPDHTWLGWTYQDLTQVPLGALIPPHTDWKVNVWPEIDGARLGSTRWTRMEGSLPTLEQDYTGSLPGLVRFQVVGGAGAALVKISLHNSDSASHRFSVVLTGVGHHKVPAWWDDQIPPDHMMCAYLERADRLMVMISGGDAMPLRRDAVAKTLCLEWQLGPGQSAEGWIVRPYKAYCSDMPALRQHDWAVEFEAGLEAWRRLRASLVQVQIPDEGVRNGLYAGLLDGFIMREPVAQGYIAGVPGTEGYRAANPGEPAIVAIALDQYGLPREAVREFEMELNQQGDDGCWADPQGWGHTGWLCPGFKSWFIREHYLMTRDRAFLEQYYPRMLASTRWNGRARARTRKLNADGSQPLTYGLMPRGFGDCGLWDDDDMIGVFLPHNFWALYADTVTLEAAGWLDRDPGEKTELQAIVTEARQHLLTALAAGAITEPGDSSGPAYRWIPGVAGKTSGSRWGALNAAVPCRIIPPEDELITGTLRYIEANMSPGGQPMRTGWLQDGMWVAITLDNVAETHLARGNGDAAAAYLYSTLNHGTPLYSWCEERDPEPGTQSQTGDRQHLWTPVAVTRAIRDMLVLEHDDGLELALGSARSWFASGEAVGVQGARTHFGALSYRLQYDAVRKQVTGEVTFEAGREPAWLRVHIRLSEGKPGIVPGAETAGETLTWRQPKGTIRFAVNIS
ncbi:MAG: hypothetical protein ACYC6L_01610 [Anaerolineae bacterium]